MRPKYSLQFILSSANLTAMTEHCTIHTDTELVVVTYCPACRGQAGGEKTAKAMTAVQRTKRARKAVQARWAKAKKKKAKR
jgi:hypothetical protein